MLVSTLALLRHPVFSRIFLARTVSTLGDNMAPIAIAFAVLATRHSAVDLGLVLAARTLPLAVFVLLGGAWADRLPRKLLMVVSDIVRLVTQGVFAVLLMTGSPPLWAMMLLQAGNGSATAFYLPASSGLLQEVTPAEHRQSANALLSLTTNVSAIAGPALAAVLIAVAGNAWAIGVDAISFGVSALLLARVAIPRRASAPRTNMRREIADGFRAVIERRWLGLQILGFTQFQFFVLGSYAVLGPLVAEKSYAGATTWAIVASAGGVGALLGDLIALRFRPRRPLVAANLISLPCTALLVALAVGAPLPVLIACGLLFGIGISLPDTYWFTALQDNVPEHLMARVSSIDWLGSLVLRPVGLAIAAPVAVLVGAGTVLVVSSGATVLTLLALLASPAIRGLRAGGPLT